MTEQSNVVFLTSVDGELLKNALASFQKPVVVRTLSELQSLARPDGVLLSFGTSVIVPPAVIARFHRGAYNLHAASPDYPGRDPHHFAVYERAVRYGATLHRMTSKVDDGPIVDVELFDVPPGIRPLQLLGLANEAAVRILARTGPRIARSELLGALPGVRWGPVKRTRQDFLAMCRIDPAIPPDELERRFHAFDGEAYANLYVEIHGRRFRLETSRESTTSE